MSSTYGLLGLLVPGERYGYELKSIVDREFAPFWRIDFAQLYRSLDKFTRAGWVRVRREPGVDGPARKVYALTPRGRVAFETWLEEPASGREALLVKVRLAVMAGLPAVSLLETQEKDWEETRARWAEARRAAQEAGDGGRVVMADAVLRELDASRAVLQMCQALLPASPSAFPVALTSEPLLITGSDDPLLTRLAEHAHASAQVVGSLGGLLALARHETDIAGAHLLDVETGEYNVPFVKHLLPEDPVVLINLALRENGLMLAPGNPKRIRTLRDLTRPGVRFINRSRGTGTRLLLAVRLRERHINPHTLHDWERAAATHSAVAAAIRTGAADAGPGLRAVAAEWGLEFISLGEERFDLVVRQAELDSPRLQPLLKALHDKEFRRAASELEGYDLTRSGKVIARVK